MLQNRLLPLAALFLLGACSDDNSGWSFDEPEEGRPGLDAAQASDTTFESVDATDPSVEPDVRLPQLDPDCRGRLPTSEQDISPREVDVIRYDLELGPKGCPHLAWSTRDAIFYSVWDGERWISEKVAEQPEYEVSLTVDPQGEPTVFVANDTPGFSRYRRDSGRWRLNDELGDRWTWSLNAQHVGEVETVLLQDSGARSTGTRIELKLGALMPAGWVFSTINTVPTQDYRGPRLAVDVDGRGLVTYLENKGYSPSDQLSNLWLARSDDERLESWTSERVGASPHNRLSFPFVHQAGGEVQIVAYSRPFNDSPAIVRGVNGPNGWSFETIVACGQDGCQHNVSGVDPGGRLHLVYGSRSALNDRTLRVYYGVEGDGWSFQELGDYEPSRAALRIDQVDGAAHLAIVRRVEEEGVRPFRELKYLPLSSPAEALDGP